MLHYVLMVVLLLFFGIKWYQSNYFGDAMKIPGPPTIPIFGNIFQLGFTMQEIFQKFIEMREKYGSVFGLWMTCFNFRVVVSDPTYVEKILISSVHLNKANTFDAFKELMGDSLLNTEAKNWKYNRKLLNPAFHVQLLQTFFQAFNSASNTLIEKLKSADDEIDVCKLATPYTLDIICETIMGLPINAQNHENQEFVNAVEENMDLIVMKFFSFIRRIDLYYRCTNSYRREKETANIIKKFVKTIIENRENKRKFEIDECSEFNGSKKRVILDTLLDLKENKIYSEQDVQHYAVTFLLAGHHTLSAAISFLLYELAKHPEIQLRILDEVHSVMGTDETEPITLQHVQQLQYTECVVKEGLRKYPPVPFFERTLSEDLIIDDTRILKGTNVLFYIHGAHHDAKFFPEPDKFDPDRFSSDRVHQIGPCSFFPFSQGPRNCIGKTFAIYQMKVVIANVIRKLAIRPVEWQHEPKILSDLVLKSANGLPVLVAAR